MVQSEGLELGCVCPACGYRCKACLGTDSVVGRDALKSLANNEMLMRDIFTSFDETAAPPEIDPSPDKWGDDQWQD
jgi:hypothetical protein